MYKYKLYIISILSIILFPLNAYSFNPLSPVVKVITKTIREGVEGLGGFVPKTTPLIVGETDQVLKKAPLEELNQSDKIIYLDDTALGNIRNNDPIIIPDSEGSQFAKESENIPSQNQKNISDNIIDTSKKMALPASGGMAYGLETSKKEKIKKKEKQK